MIKAAEKADQTITRGKKSDNTYAEKGNEGMKANCNFCGYEREKSREKCSAWGKTCDSCKGRNHFKSKCKTVHALSQFQNGNDDYDDQLCMAVNHKKESIMLVYNGK